MPQLYKESGNRILRSAPASTVCTGCHVLRGSAGQPIWAEGKGLDLSGCLLAFWVASRYIEVHRKSGESNDKSK